ncbi:MAG: hypothetical protein P8179_11505 [Candidatus Thiodiazotropha sp.]
MSAPKFVDLEQCVENDHQASHTDAWYQEEDELPELKLYDAYRAFHSQLSKITWQVWRFLKNCFREKHSLLLYQRPLMWLDYPGHTTSSNLGA